MSATIIPFPKRATPTDKANETIRQILSEARASRAARRDKANAEKTAGPRRKDRSAAISEGMKRAAARRKELANPPIEAKSSWLETEMDGIAELIAERAGRKLVEAFRAGRFNEVADPMIARIRELQDLA